MLFAMLTLGAVVAYGSSVDESIVDVTAPTGSVTLAPGGSGAITINVTVTGRQANPATFDVYRNWTLSGGSFTGSNPQTFTVNPRAAADPATTFSTSGTVSVNPGQTAGTFTLAVGAISIVTSAPAALAAGTLSNYSVTVSAPPPSNTAPSVSVVGVTDGASYEIGSVPTSMCQVTDAEDGNSSFAATLSAITGPYTSDGIGEQTASCSYTDAGGLTASASATYGIVDPSPPSIGYTLSPSAADGTNGWYRSDVSVTWKVSDPESPNSLQTLGCVDQSITADQSSTDYPCSATSAGGSAGPVTVSIKRDATKPTISGSGSPAANGAGWNNTDVSVSFACHDNLSGIVSCGPNQVLSSEGANQSASGTAVDNAGNSDSATVDGINIDKTAPSVSLVGGPADGASYYYGLVPAAPTCTASDGLSGLAGACSISGYETGLGPHTVTASATDNAGNAASNSHSYTVLAWTLKGFYQPTDMGGVFNVVKGGSTVPLKFEIFAGSTELTDTVDVASLRSGEIACTATVPTDDIEATATGGTSLRYDLTAGQFVFNWQTPKAAGKCYSVTVNTRDGSSLVAYFKLK